MQKQLVISVRKIRHFNKNTKFAVFTAELLRKNRSGHLVPSKQVKVFTGKFFSLSHGDRLTVVAEERETMQYGKEMRVISYHREMPGTTEELRRFLQNINGLGFATVNRILDKYGLDALSVIRSDPQALINVGVPQKRSDLIRAELEENQYFEEILTFLQLNELDHRYAMPIFQEYGGSAVSVMRDAPYKLFYKDIFRFSAADRLHHAMGLNENDPNRLEAGLLAYLLEDAQACGNLFAAGKGLEKKLTRFLNGQKSGHVKIQLIAEQVAQAADRLSKARFVHIASMNGETNYYLAANYWAETEIVKDIQRLNDGVKNTFYKEQDIDNYLNSIPGLRLAPAQRQAVITAMTNSISVLTGGPGTGKTQTLNTLIGAIRNLSPKATFRICAPTGRAALRITELTGMPAATIHRTLKLGGWKSAALKEEELICDYLIVDEFSMVDCVLCAKLLRAAASTCRVVIVGDHEQLPSVGPGLVLRDFINSGKIPVTRLTQVFRQGKQFSRISENAHRIIRYDGNGPLNLAMAHKPGEDFYFLPRDSVSEIQKAVCSSVRKLMKDYGLKMDEIRVLSPIHGTELGTDALNTALQDAFNPKGEPYEREDGLELRVGDPVVHIKNDYDLDVFNGEAGVITALGYDPDKAVLVEYPGGHRVWYSDQQTEELTLGYCTTVHKSQGSEFKAVIMPLHETTAKTATRNLMYTGITRAKQIVLLIGSKQAFSDSFRRDQIEQRNSNLIERLQAV